MKNDEMYIKWLQLTSNLIQKYDLDNISIKVEEHFIGLNIDKARYKELLKINIKDEWKYIVRNELYDILVEE